MILGIDYDGVVVQKGWNWPEVTDRPVMMPGAMEGLFSLKKAGHVLLLYSARANRALREDPTLDPLVRAGIRRIDIAKWERRDKAIHVARYEAMIRHVERDLSGVFDAIDDGVQGKPSCDLFLDDLAIKVGPGTGGYGWRQIAQIWGEPVYSSSGNLKAANGGRK